MKPPLLLPMDYRVILRSEPLWMLGHFAFALAAAAFSCSPTFWSNIPCHHFTSEACWGWADVYFFKTIRAA